MEILNRFSLKYTRSGRSGRTEKSRGWFAIALVILGSLLCSSALSDGDVEHQVKAAFIYNFAKYTDWPSGANSGSLVIGIVGHDPFGGTIDRTMSGKSVGGRSIVVKRISFGPEMKHCAIVFISAADKDKVGKLGDVLKGAPVLTVGESPGFASKGGIINLTVDGGKVRFEINPGAAKKAKLSIQAKLMGLAKIVG